MLVKTLFLFIFMASICNTMGQVCNTYELTTSSEPLKQLQAGSVGLYSAVADKKCHGKVTYKHVLNERYLYVSDGNIWIVGDSESYKTCTNSGYLYRIHRPLPDVPKADGWLFHDWIRNYWLADDSINITCTCHLVILTSRDRDARLEQPELLGIYVIDNEHKCNDHVTYRHVKNNRYIFMGNDARWVASNAHDHDACEKSSASPLNAYHDTVSETPEKGKWLYFDNHRKKYRHDNTMNTHCITDAEVVADLLKHIH